MRKKQLETINYEKQIIRNVLNFSIYERFNPIKAMREFDGFRCEIYCAGRTAIVHTADEWKQMLHGTQFNVIRQLNDSISSEGELS